jgi:hypothetical protein
MASVSWYVLVSTPTADLAPASTLHLLVHFLAHVFHDVTEQIDRHALSLGLVKIVPRLDRSSALAALRAGPDLDRDIDVDGHDFARLYCAATRDASTSSVLRGLHSPAAENTKPSKFVYLVRVEVARSIVKPSRARPHWMQTSSSPQT